MVEKSGNISLAIFLKNPNDATGHILALPCVTFLGYHMSHSQATMCEHIGVHYSHKCRCKCSHKNSSLNTCIKLLYLYYVKTIFHLSLVTSIIGNFSFVARLIFSQRCKI